MTTIRCARTYDAPELAELCGELGYPATRQQVVRRLAAIEACATGKVFVAEHGDGRVIGWLHVASTPHLVDEDVAEILGLVVAPSMRGAGIGARLMRAAEAWARSRGVRCLRVRSRMERTRAHRFYHRDGYIVAKTQLVLVKPMQAEAEVAPNVMQD